MLDGCVEAAERVMNVPVRVGTARDIAGLKDEVNTPQYANGVGLLKYGIRASQVFINTSRAQTRRKIWFNRTKMA